MKKRIITTLTLISGLLIGAHQLRAQGDKRTMTLAEYTAGSPEYIYPSNIWGLQWLGQELISYQPDRLRIKRVSDKEWRTLLTLSQLSTMLDKKGVETSSLRSFPYSYTALPNGKLEITFPEHIVLLSESLNHIESVLSYPKNSQAHSQAPNHKHIAFVSNHNLYVRDSNGSTEQITNDGSNTIVYGQVVYQNEFGVDKGLFWSPDGRKVAFYRMDQSMVKPYPILHVNAERPYSEDQYYPMAGTPLHLVKLAVYDTETKLTTYIDSPDPSKTYITNIAWSPKSNELLIAELNREQTHMNLKAYSPSTGKELRVIISEHNNIYTEPQHPALFLLGKDNEFIWSSRRDGYEHLYLYNLNGKLIRQLTQGEWEVTSIQSFSPDGKELFYTSTEVSPIERHLYKVNFSNSQRTRLTEESGWHTPLISPNRKQFIDIYESMHVGKAISVKDLKGKVLNTLLDVDNPDAKFLTPQIRLGTLKAADGKTDLHYRLILPYNFDSKKKYPTIVYVYNGPHAQLVQNRYRGAARGWELNMANEGYIIFTVDGRGSAFRGSAFEQVIHRQLGKNEMADQMQGVNYLRSLSYVDTNRIGVYGWSFGGFMTTNLMLTYPETFKVGVAGGPVMDWARYEIMYGERYMDTPQENPEGYKASNLLLRAGDLKGRLMLIHGTIDPVVIWQHSLLFLRESVHSGSHPDYMVYPEHKHNVMGPDRVHLNEIITRYFKDHL